MRNSSGINEKNWTFLSRGGEMGELTRNYDWSTTSLDTPDKWPQNLCTTLSILLSSKFPMVLLWGEDLIQFYNDAYRPSLGKKGKHPDILGKKANESWAEIWHVMNPLVKKVFDTGEASWNEDQILPIYREGKIIDVYWTFGLNPVFGASGKVDGILIICTETTGKVKASLKLKESEERFRTMAENTDIFIATSDESGRIDYFNKSWTKLTGRSMNELIENGWTDLIHHDEKKEFELAYNGAKANHQPLSAQFRILNKNGQYTWLLANMRPRYDYEGNFVGQISSCVDISRQKETEKLLFESEQQISSMVEYAPFPIGVYVGDEMIIELANKTILDIWGKGDDVIGKSFKEVLPEFDKQNIFDQIENVYKTGIPFHAKNQQVEIIINGHKNIGYYNYSFTPLYNSKGDIYGVMNSGEDVTDLNLANAKVQESEKKLRETILQAPVAMSILKGPDYNVELANEKMFELWTRSPEEMLNKPIFDALPEVAGKGLDKLLNKAYQTGKTYSAQAVPVKFPRNGKKETVYVDFVFQAHHSAKGKVSGILAIAIDVTLQVATRQKIEELVNQRTEELAEANQDLKKSNSELAQFAHIASHDLQEPLRKISIFTQLLENKIGHLMEESSLTYLDKIRKSSFRMHRMIKDVLTYSELVNEEKSFTKVDLKQVMESILNDYEMLIAQKGATIKTDELPEIVAVPLQMSQLLGNIIGNALKFTHTERVPYINISVTGTGKEEKQKLGLVKELEYVKIQIEDNGIGFHEDFKDQIFDIFQRLHGKTEYEGTGIGLALCKKIVLNHLGAINAEGTPDKGAVFNVFLPLTISEERNSENKHITA